MTDLNPHISLLERRGLVGAASKLARYNLATVQAFVERGDLTGALRNVGWAKERIIELEAALLRLRLEHGERD